MGKKDVCVNWSRYFGVPMAFSLAGRPTTSQNRRLGSQHVLKVALPIDVGEEWCGFGCLMLFVSASIPFLVHDSGLMILDDSSPSFSYRVVFSFNPWKSGNPWNVFSPQPIIDKSVVWWNPGCWGVPVMPPAAYQWLYPYGVFQLGMCQNKV